MPWWIKNKMGLRLSRPDCNLSVRSLLQIDNAREILKSCVSHRISYMSGTLLVLFVVLLWAHVQTRNKDPTTNVVIPLWLVSVPVMFCLVYAYTVQQSVLQEFDTERAEFMLSGMTKRDFLNYRIGDDRASKAFQGTLTSAALLSGTNLLAPYFRADR